MNKSINRKVESEFEKKRMKKLSINRFERSKITFEDTLVQNVSKAKNLEIRHTHTHSCECDEVRGRVCVCVWSVLFVVMMIVEWTKRENQIKLNECPAGGIESTGLGRIKSWLFMCVTSSWLQQKNGRSNWKSTGWTRRKTDESSVCVCVSLQTNGETSLARNDWTIDDDQRKDTFFLWFSLHWFIIIDWLTSICLNLPRSGARSSSLSKSILNSWFNNLVKAWIGKSWVWRWKEFLNQLQI